MDNVYRDKFNDRLVQLTAKVNNANPYEINILGKKETHIELIRKGISTMKDMINHDGYDLRKVDSELKRLEDYATVFLRV